MDLLLSSLDILLHLDKYLITLANDLGTWTYLILFLTIFAETGLVITPFLPGDSLLFIVGALSASGEFNVMLMSIVLMSAAILGDTVNFHIGKFVGTKIFLKENPRLFKKEYLIRTQSFYEKHGGKTIIIARFIPIIRTFAPFVAGIGKMRYRRFISYNIVGAILWVSLFVSAGYFFGNIPAVEENFTLVILAIIFISLLPGIITFINNKKSTRR